VFLGAIHAGLCEDCVKKGGREMAHDDQFTAVGPPLSGSGFPRSGFSTKATGMVYGANVAGDRCGVLGASGAGGRDSIPKVGVQGTSDTGVGVFGISGGDGSIEGQDGTAVKGISDNWTGVGGFSKRATGVFGHSDSGWGVHGKSEKGLAGRFEGDVEVTGDVRLIGADCAEEFDVVETEIVEPGTVMVLGEKSELRPSYKAYDKRVAGVISGAGDYRPGLVLDKQPSQRKRQPIALLGKAYCKVDAEYAPIEIGDLLTTSPTQGHAMKATDPLKAFGTVIGKALRPVMEAQNLIPVLITLQ
jgi:hypothetical protein